MFEPESILTLETGIALSVLPLFKFSQTFFLKFEIIFPDLHKMASPILKLAIASFLCLLTYGFIFEPQEMKRAFSHSSMIFLMLDILMISSIYFTEIPEDRIFKKETIAKIEDSTTKIKNKLYETCVQPVQKLITKKDSSTSNFIEDKKLSGVSYRSPLTTPNSVAPKSIKGKEKINQMEQPEFIKKS